MGLKLIKSTKILKSEITSIICRKDNSAAYFSDYWSNIKCITWKPNSFNVEDFDFSKSTKQVDDKWNTYSIVLINEEKELLVGSSFKFYLLNSKTLDTIQQFQVEGYYVQHFGLIE